MESTNEENKKQINETLEDYIAKQIANSQIPIGASSITKETFEMYLRSRDIDIRSKTIEEYRQRFETNLDSIRQQLREFQLEKSRMILEKKDLLFKSEILRIELKNALTRIETLKDSNYVDRVNSKLFEVGIDLAGKIVGKAFGV